MSWLAVQTPFVPLCIWCHLKINDMKIWHPCLQANVFFAHDSQRNSLTAVFHGPFKPPGKTYYKDVPKLTIPSNYNNSANSLAQIRFLWLGTLGCNTCRVCALLAVRIIRAGCSTLWYPGDHFKNRIVIVKSRFCWIKSNTIPSWTWHGISKHKNTEAFHIGPSNTLSLHCIILLIWFQVSFQSKEPCTVLP